MRKQHIYTQDELLQSLHNGVGDGFATIFNELYRPVYHFTFSILKNKEEAEDVTDDCFLKLWERRKQFSSLARCKAYLYVCVRNGAIDMLRKRKMVAASCKEMLYLYGTGENNLFEQTLSMELAKQLQHAVDLLPPSCKKIIMLTFTEGMTNLQAAKALNLSVNTIKNQKHRGLAMLRSRIIPLITLFISCTSQFIFALLGII